MESDDSGSNQSDDESILSYKNFLRHRQDGYNNDEDLEQVEVDDVTKKPPHGCEVMDFKN